MRGWIAKSRSSREEGQVVEWKAGGGRKRREKQVESKESRGKGDHIDREWE